MKSGPLLLAAATVIYCGALIPILQPQAWMWMVWGPAWLLFSAAAGIHVLRGGEWQRAVIPWSAAVAFSIVAVLAALLEIGRFANVGFVFAVLGAGMVGSVALFMMSYDRSKRPAAEVD